MVDPNEHEAAAMQEAGEIAGQYIEAMGRTDMASWSVDEWRGFVEAICGAYVDSLVARQAALNAAMAKVQSRPA